LFYYLPCSIVFNALRNLPAKIQKTMQKGASSEKKMASNSTMSTCLREENHTLFCAKHTFLPIWRKITVRYFAPNNIFLYLCSEITTRNMAQEIIGREQEIKEL